jgi:DMSO reductase family type II enzyme heme b subunit
MKRRLKLIAAPPSYQPGDYVGVAYADATRALTPEADLEIEKSLLGWRISLVWRCANPATTAAGDTNRFADAAALLVPAHPDAPMISMGASDLPVEGFLWRTDWKAPMKIRAEGFGTVQRLAAPQGWTAVGTWQQGFWSVRFEFPGWPALERQMRAGAAIWQGANAQRAGLKSVTGDWLEVRV